MSKGEDDFELLLEAHGMEGWEREYRFAPPRRWRADFCHHDAMVLVEIEGGTWVGGRHTRGSGFEKDCEKYNAAAELGYAVLRYTTAQSKTIDCINQIRHVLANRLADR